MNLKGRNFITLLDFTPEEIGYLIELSARLKREKYEGKLGHINSICSIGNSSKNIESNSIGHFKLLQNDIYKKLDEWAEIATSKDLFKINYNKLKELISKL